MNFDEAFEKLIGHEGGYQCNPADKGNWSGGSLHSGILRGTKYGISAAAFPDIDIHSLTLEQAKEIYKRDYWEPLISDAIPQNIRFTMFDMAVNSGVKFAIKTLQQALGVEPDGVVGEQTRFAIHSISSRVLANRINAVRLMEMADMSAFATFGRGWVKRVAKSILADNLA